MKINRRESVMRYISKIYRKGTSHISKELSKYGVGAGQMMFLMELYRQDGVHQEELCEKLDIDKGTTARAIKRLEEEQIIQRVRDEHDKRAYKIYLTEHGWELKETVIQVLDEWNECISDDLTEEECEVLTKILKKVCINIGG